MKIAISVDSAADLSKELIEKYNIAVVPFTVNLGDDSRLDGINVNGAELLDFVDEKDELPKTTALSNYQRQVFTCTKDKHHGASNRHGVYLL